MRIFIRGAFWVLFLGLLSTSLFAQEKSQYYYSTHENEIIPDATKAFQDGKYERAAELCMWHYVIVGDKKADSLRDKAERCVNLSKEMTDYFDAGKRKEARETAQMLLALNPNDTAALHLLEELDKPDVSVPIDTIAEVKPVVKDTIETEKPLITENLVEEPIDIPVRTIEDEAKEEPVAEMPIAPVTPRESESPHTKFVLKAGVAALNLERISEAFAPGGSFGFYDLGGSRMGLEVGGYLCSDLLSSGSLFGVDGSLVLRLSKSVYPKIGVGYFSFTGKSDSGAATHGLCAGGGLTFILGGHFALEFGAKYYPEIRTRDVESVSTTPGSTYEFPLVMTILSGGIAPFVSIGWAF